MHFTCHSSLLLTRMGATTPYLDPAAIASNAHPQSDSAFMQLSPEIPNAIFQQLWQNAGASHHIILQGGRYRLARCVTDHAAADDLMDECNNTRTSSFNDPLIFQRLVSPWGNHWKCEELYQSRQTESSPFLAAMLTCSQLYFECRTSIYHNLTFVIHNVETLHRLAVSRPSPLLSNMKHLQLAIRVPIRREQREKMSPEAHKVMSRWRQCCSVLEKAENLVSVDMWLDTTEPGWRGCLSWVLEGNANPYVFSERLASILTVDIPVNPDRPEAWKDVANLEPRFTIRARGWPTYKAEPSSTQLHCIIRLADWEEPGVPLPTLRAGPRYPHRARPRRYW
ncbi:hypothetical protein B0J13DRAFT_587964 [Dactylonectria estremocensis]|uniref:DUF7730 domain-containing protein n=1 Tax=Dactylonectria estremocensis TaxID=1079267 RepID=A0A9P9IQU4_9HYPO|nr:hypothetical protein B0J13DRAFT_587964 [Dactylonectria estremocensis]